MRCQQTTLTVALAALFALGTFGCAPPVDAEGQSAMASSRALDSDGDGSADEDDCRPNDPNSYPGAHEICDGQDNDCDGVVPGTELDHDYDGFSVCAGDCGPDDPAYYPGAPEDCDGLDQDCDGSALGEGDKDGDGIRGCDDDCDDTDSDVYEGAPEICDGQDNNCDGLAPGELDPDNDGVPDCADNCMDVPNPAQTDSNGDGVGNACSSCLPGDPDSDNDGICDVEDLCSSAKDDWAAGVPSSGSLGSNRWMYDAFLVNGADDLTQGSNGNSPFVNTNGYGNGGTRGYTLKDTRGCMCSDIIAAQGLGNGHTKFGCSNGVVQNWIAWAATQ